LQIESFDDHLCRPFFAGLLPEGRLRQLIAQQCQVSNQNDFALLNAIGGECAGAITFTPIDGYPPDCNYGEVEWLNDQQLLELLDELPRNPMLVGRDGLRLSLAGAQDKLPVVFDGRQIGLPKNGQPSTHILKPPIQAVDDSVINEGFCLALANAMQLEVARSEIIGIAERKILLVERYDRRIDINGKLIRVHQEDFCQALGIAPEMKYQNEGGPDFKSCFELLRKLTRPSAPQVLRFLDYVVFNALLGNNDAHAKNYSLLYKSEIPTLAPLYDVLCTDVYSNLTHKMAMKIGSKYKFIEVQVKHWENFAEETGLSKAQTKKRIITIANEMTSIASNVKMSQYFVNESLIQKIVNLIEKHAKLTVQRLVGEV
jgi:serine/threonine-protein kinase HipA